VIWPIRGGKPEDRGAASFRRDPSSRRSFGGPFNGQRGRCLIFTELVQVFQPQALLETGTFRAATTEWISAFQLPVYSMENDPEVFGFARERMRGFPNVHVLPGDSRKRLIKLLNTSLAGDVRLLAYLDAHWNADDLPLVEELERIYRALPDAVVMIDDFVVPDDEDYRFDSYRGVALGPDLIQPAVDEFGLAALYPVLEGRMESGKQRGCVVLMAADLHRRHGAELRTLRTL
jgi:hypothetical protein